MRGVFLSNGSVVFLVSLENNFTPYFEHLLNFYFPISFKREITMGNTDPPLPGATLPPGRETSGKSQKIGPAKNFDLAELIELDEKGKK